jgi:hypothetical protein
VLLGSTLRYCFLGEGGRGFGSAALGGFGGFGCTRSYCFRSMKWSGSAFLSVVGRAGWGAGFFAAIGSSPLSVLQTCSSYSTAWVRHDERVFALAPSHRHSSRLRWRR